MMRWLRAGGGTGLVYGQGEFVTKHHAILLASASAGGAALAEEYSVQAEADARRGPVPPTVDPVAGPATLEAATILYQRDGSVGQGVAVLRLPDGSRTIAPVPPGDAATLDVITAGDRSPVGRCGMIARGADGRLCWAAA